MHHLYLKLKLTDLMYAKQNDAGDGHRNTWLNNRKKASKETQNIRISMDVPERKANKRKFKTTNCGSVIESSAASQLTLEWRDAMNVQQFTLYIEQPWRKKKKKKQSKGKMKITSLILAIFNSISKNFETQLHTTHSIIAEKVFIAAKSTFPFNTQTHSHLHWRKGYDFASIEHLKFSIFIELQLSFIYHSHNNGELEMDAIFWFWLKPRKDPKTSKPPTLKSLSFFLVCSFMLHEICILRQIEATRLWMG